MAGGSEGGGAPFIRSYPELRGDVAPALHALDAAVLDVAVPRVIEEVDADPGLRERERDRPVVLAERLELELLREPDLVARRALGVVAPARGRRAVRLEVPARPQVHRLRVLEDPLLAQPRLGDHAPALGARGDEVHLVPGGDDPLEHDRAVLVHLELAEERAVVELAAEAVLVLGSDVGDLRERVPPRLRREIDAELRRELPQIGHRALRHHVVEIHSDPHVRVHHSPTRTIALNAQCAAMVVTRLPVARRSHAKMTPPAATTTIALTMAMGVHGEATPSVVCPMVPSTMAPCHSANAHAEATIAARTPSGRTSAPSSAPRNAISSGRTTLRGSSTATCTASSDPDTGPSGA